MRPSLRYNPQWQKRAARKRGSGKAAEKEAEKFHSSVSAARRCYVNRNSSL